MKTLAEKIAVMQAAAEGKPIEGRFRPNSVTDEERNWEQLTNPNWNWSVWDYRVKPEPKTLFVVYDTRGIITATGDDRYARDAAKAEKGRYVEEYIQVLPKEK